MCNYIFPVFLVALLVEKRRLYAKSSAASFILSQYTVYFRGYVFAHFAKVKKEKHGLVNIF